VRGVNLKLGKPGERNDFLANQEHEQIARKYYLYKSLVSALLFMPLIGDILLILYKGFLIATFSFVFLLVPFVIFYVYLSYLLDVKYKRLPELPTPKEIIKESFQMFIVSVILYSPTIILGILFSELVPSSALIVLLPINTIIALVIILTFYQMKHLSQKPGIEVIEDPYFHSLFPRLEQYFKVKIDNAYIINPSAHLGLFSVQKKTANAWQIGYRKFNIVLTKYLMGNMTKDEISAVIAHEIAHASKQHGLKLLPISIFPILSLNLLLLGVVGVIEQYIGYLSISISIFITTFGLPALSKKYEREADQLAANATSKEAMISALNKLADLNLMPRSYKSGSHPCVKDRIRSINKIENDN
jgi:Zn-dependent protease with chaperone function